MKRRVCNLKPKLLPWEAPQVEARFRKHIRRELSASRKRNPALARRFRKMSDLELYKLEVALLSLLPQTPDNTYHMRLLDSIIHRAEAPPRRSVEAAPYTPLDPVDATSPALTSENASSGSVTAGQPAPEPIPEPAPTQAEPDPLPSNVIPFFGPKAFHNGKHLARGPYWIGGEV